MTQDMEGNNKYVSRSRRNMPKMPVQSPPRKKSNIVHRSESLRSQVSDASQQSKRVSFNRDVHVKRIPSAVVDRNGKLVAVLVDDSSSSSSTPTGGGAAGAAAFPHHHRDRVEALNGKGSFGGDDAEADEEYGATQPHQLHQSSPGAGRLWINALAPQVSREEVQREAEAILKQVGSVTCRSSSSATSAAPSRTSPKPRAVERSKTFAARPLVKKGAKVAKSSSRISDFLARTIIPSRIRPSARSKSPSSPPELSEKNALRRSHSPPKRDSRSRSRSRELTPGSVDLADFLSRSEPNLYNGIIKYSKSGGGIGGKIKKAHSGRRAALNSISDSPSATSSSGCSSGSGSDKDSFPSKKKLSSSESPVSSLSSGPEDLGLSMASSPSYDKNNRVSNLVEQFVRNGRRNSSERAVEAEKLNSAISPLSNSHNNNQPFSYLKGATIASGEDQNQEIKAPPKPVPPPPKEVIYAQVVCSKEDSGAPSEKRTVHTTVSNGGKTSSSSTVGKGHKMDDYKNPYSSYKPSYNARRYNDDYDDDLSSSSKPKNNVTTVLLNNADDDDTSFSSGAQRYNSSSYYNPARNGNSSSEGYRNRSPSPSPGYKPGVERTFYFGAGQEEPVETRFTSPPPVSPPYRYSSKSPGRFQSYSSSREASPMNNNPNMSRDLGGSRSSPMIPSSAKLVSSYGAPPASGPTNRYRASSYDLMDDDSSRHSSPARNYVPNNNSYYEDSEVLLSKPKYKSSYDLDRHSSKHSNNTTSYHNHDTSSSTMNRSKYLSSGSSRHVTPHASSSSINKMGLRSKESSPRTRDYSKSSSPEKYKSPERDSSMERKYNRKNKTTSASSTFSSADNNTKSNNNTLIKSSNSGGGGGGLISTLMRRNKDKKKEVKESKEKKETRRSPNMDSSPSNNHSSDDQAPTPNGTTTTKLKRSKSNFFSEFLHKNFSSRKNLASSSSHDVSSSNTNNVEPKSKKFIKPTDSEIEEAERRRDGDAYQSWSSDDEQYRFGYLKEQNGGLTRGKSYNFGDFKNDSDSKPWNDQNDSDYRRELASSRCYTSATLGRPGAKTSRVTYDDDSDAVRSKSLDRRAYRSATKSKSPPPRIMVTPNTPAVEDSDTDKWKSTYNPIVRTFDRNRVQNGHSKLGKKVSGLSRSSYELDEHDGYEDRRNNRLSSDTSGKLRYFGDTDGEEINSYHQTNGSSHHHHHPHRPSRTRLVSKSPSFLSSSKSRDQYAKYDTVQGSSFNSSGSENGSRMSKASSNAGSQRSVYLHAPAVAEIPPTGLQRRTMSRDELSNHSGHQKQTKHLARSMSVLAPWRPKHFQNKFEREVNYSNDATKENQSSPSRPPKPPRSPNRKSMSPSFGRAESTDSLLKNSPDGKSTMGKSSTLGRSNKENVGISRSKSIPKDTRFAGWLRRRKVPKEVKMQA